MSEFDDIIEKAAALPLLDAAFDLWLETGTLHALEGWRHIWPPPGMYGNDIDARVRYMRATAHENRMFDWLKMAHPAASDDDARQAIRAAVKFEDDCFRHFGDRSVREDGSVEQAVNLARREHPDYQERTYKRAGSHLSFMMR
jgi:hypothetical protein